MLRAIQGGETLSSEDNAFANTNWGDIKHDKEASKSFFAAAQADKARVMAEIQEAAFSKARGAPDGGVFRAPGDGPGTFRVDASVSEIPGDFRMRLDDGPGGGGKACRTIVEVLEKGFFKGQPVTKVLLRCVWRWFSYFCFRPDLLVFSCFYPGLCLVRLSVL